MLPTDEDLAPLVVPILTSTSGRQVTEPQSTQTK